MTAVIGILNKSAVAIAADSAVTVGGPKGPKIFNRANKIFTISKTQPVALMIYNHGEFMGTPWETLIKLYRSKLGTTSFGTVEEYKNHFIAFLRDNHFFCDIQQQKKILSLMIVDYLRGLLNAVMSDNQPLIQSRLPNMPQLIAEAFETRIDSMIAKPFDQSKASADFKDFTMAEFEAFGFLGIQQAINSALVQSGIPVRVPELIPKIKDLTFRNLASPNFYNYFSGLIFCGFGKDEIFPRLIPVNLSIAINERLKYVDDDAGRAIISHDEAAMIRPFAQKDVIDTVLAGISPGLHNLYLSQFQEFIAKHTQVITSLFQPLPPNAAQKLASLDFQAITKALNQLILIEQKKRYINPMMQAIVTLSKEDLAEMAESLIYLTYLKRRFTFSAESVGGPVDVAIITKGDGFIWIKRKHYFDPQLNHQFFDNY